MSNRATITFSQTGVQPPVYVVTSLSDPPWEPIEMHVDKDQTASADLVFLRYFDNVEEGSYQYKIRVGDGHWVVDESKDSTTDEHGNRNNVIHIKPDSIPKRQESASNTVGESMPVPVVVLEKVPEKESEHKDTELHALATDVSKRAADARPDFETTKEETPTADEQSKSPDVPLLVVEKTDNKPVYGDNFGDDATPAQKVAHDMRSADAEPDKLKILSNDNEDSSAREDQAAPPFRHESLQTDEQPSVIDTIDEVSVHSTGYTNSEGFVTTPSEPGEPLNNDDLVHRLLMSHEIDARGPHNELTNGNLLSHELRSGEGDDDELIDGPLLSHEIGRDGDPTSFEEDEGFDELDAAPLLSHESGFSQRGGNIGVNSHSAGSSTSEPRHYMDDDEDDDEDDNYYDDTPLLPHERESAIEDHPDSDHDASYMLHERPTFEHETDNAEELFTSNGQFSMFRTRTNSSMLPHRLPRSDADDEDLLDPSLERFPTGREQILERVATIGLHLPEDQTVEDAIHSPVTSVLSQACSSVDLVPVKSYASLASVPEALNSDEEEEYDDNGVDMDSLPSPLVMHSGSATNDFASAPLDTPLPSDSKRLELTDNNMTKAPSDREAHTSEPESVSKNDGTKDTILTKLRDGIASPTNVLNLGTSEKQSTSTSNDNDRAVPGSESDMQGQHESGSQDTSVRKVEPKDIDNPQPPVQQESDTQDEKSLQNLLNGENRIRASTTVFVVGVAVAVYYAFALV